MIDDTKAPHSSTGENVATCQKRAVCDTCGITYGDFANHDWNTSLEKDATGHWYGCNTANCTEKKDFAEHKPDHDGGATVDYAILCTDCGWTIEQQLVHTHVFDKEVAQEQYLASKANCNDSAKYYKSCACGEKGTETFESGVANGHTPGTEWKSDKDNHWNECTCGEKANIAVHKDENTDGKCDVCIYNVGISGGDKPADPPQTGDNSMIDLWIILLCVSAMGIVAITVLSKKKSV